MTTDTHSPDDNYMGLVENEVLHAKHYIQLISVTKYKYRAGEIWQDPFYPPKKDDKGTVVRAVFFITTNDKTKIVNVLYRAFGPVRRKTDLDKIATEIQRRAHIMYYSRKVENEELAMQQIQLEHANWSK